MVAQRDMGVGERNRMIVVIVDTGHRARSGGGGETEKGNESG